MKMMCYILCAAFLIIVACDGGTIQKPGADTTVVSDTDQTVSDDLFNDDGQLINDDGQLINDDDEMSDQSDGSDLLVADDGAIWPDDEWPDSDIEGACGSNGNCGEKEYCAKPNGTCDAYLAGTCETRPTEEECWIYSAIIYVCGCDDVTYQHPCFAQAAGVNIAYEGECGTVVTCKTNEECGDFVAMLCQKATGVCENGTGACVTPETGCPEIYAPVCGCDGNTYSNECMAHANFMNVAYEGECGGGEGCYSNEECPSEPNGGKGFCQFQTGTCYGPGICDIMPVACDGMYAPVCGCDGNTYSNECLANSNGVSVSYDGECGGEEKYSTLYYYYDLSTDEPPMATVLIVNGEQTVTFEGADLITRTPFNGGVTLGTTFYGPDGGGVVNLLLTLYSNGFSLPYTVTLDGSENYAQWTNFYGGGPTELLGNLYGEVTVSQYQRDSNGTVTLIELSGGLLTYTPN